MKQSVLIFLLFIVNSAFRQDFPAPPDPPRLVNDFANMLSESERQSLEAKLVAFDDTTSSQIAIVTVSSLNGYDVSDYSFQLAEAWGIGQQGKDNGILILVAPSERKMWIATGYGVEASVPDAEAFRIVDSILRPNFRNEDYYQGLDQAITRLMGLISGEFQPEASPEGGNPIGFIVFFVLLVMVVIIFLIRKGGGGNNNRGRGHFPPIITLGNPYSSGSSWGNFSSGSGSFGGFGGGSFGGGGAGGSW